MRVLQLTMRITLLAVLGVGAIGATAPARARADVGSPRVTLALSADPGASKKDQYQAQVADQPDRPAAEDAVTAPAHGSSWWVWLLMGVAAAGVAGLVIASTGKDPGCPADRVCR